jgi:hypothetical protein
MAYDLSAVDLAATKVADAAVAAAVAPLNAQIVTLNAQIAALQAGQVTPPPPPSGAFPGQAGNPVGHAAAPGYPGSLTPHAMTGWASGTTYSFLDIDTGAGKFIAISMGSGLHDIKFIGCRFQSNNPGSTIAIQGAQNITFEYCTFAPQIAFYTKPPGGGAWPSAGGVNVSTAVPDVNAVNGNKGYNFAVYVQSGGPVTFKHCDVWGFGNGMSQIDATTAPMLYDNCWIHDARDGKVFSDHTDGVGCLLGTNPCKNVTINACTIATIGISNGIAFQATNSPYDNLVMTGNYLSGYGFTLDPCHGKGTNLKVTDNILATDIQWYWGPVYPNGPAIFTGTTNVWRRNKFKYKAGSLVRPGSGGMAFSAADDGKFIWPDSTLHTTDFAG